MFASSLSCVNVRGKSDTSGDLKTNEDRDGLYSIAMLFMILFCQDDGCKMSNLLHSQLR